MKTNKLIIAIITSTVLLVSCEKEIEFNGEQTDPKLVINSLMEPGQPVKARIGKSCFFLDYERDHSMPEGTVAQLYINDNFVGNMDMVTDSIEVMFYTLQGDSIGYQFEKHFQSDYCPQEGDVVKITASAPGFDDVEAETSPLPNALEAQLSADVAHWDSWYEYAYNDTYEEKTDSLLKMNAEVTLTLELTDPNPGQVDCFKIYIPNWKHDHPLQNSYDCSFEYDDPIFGSALPNNEYIDFSDLDTKPLGVFTDVLFDGKSYQLKFKMTVWLTVDVEYDPAFFQLPIKLEHLSKEYYNYLYTCDQGDMSMQLFAEPIQTYSNVKGGYGIVAGHTVDTLWFALPLEE